MTRVGFMTTLSRLLRAQGEQIPTLRLHQEPTVEPHEQGSDRAAVGSDTADEGTAFSRKEMHIALDVAHGELSPQANGGGRPPRERRTRLQNGRPAAAAQT